MQIYENPSTSFLSTCFPLKDLLPKQTSYFIYLSTQVKNSPPIGYLYLAD